MASERYAMAKSSVVAVGAYGGASAVLAVLLVLPYMPGTAAFFAAHSFAWGLASILVTLQRKHAWESAGIPDGVPWRKDWSEHGYPAWAFDGAFVIHLIDVPMAVGMALKICTDMNEIRRAAVETLDEMPDDVRYGPSFALEHCIFASHFGMFMGDFVVHWSRPSAMFIGHHLCSMFLLWSASLVGVVPGVVVLAFCTPVLEIGSMGYCIWVIWRMRGLYFWSMMISNLVYFALILVILSLVPERTWFFLTLVAGGIGLIMGRTANLYMELRAQPIKVD